MTTSFRALAHAAFGLVISLASAWAFAAVPAQDDPTVQRALRYLQSPAGRARACVTFGETFRPTAITTGPKSIVHVHLDRWHGALPVIGGDVIVHIEGTHYSTSQTVVRPVTLDLHPRVSADAASAMARLQLRAGADTVETAPELAILASPTSSEYRLIWRVKTHFRTGDLLASRWFFLVDANTGELVRAVDSIRSAKPVLGIGQTSLFGDVTLNTTRVGTPLFDMIDSTEEGNGFNVRIFPVGKTFPPLKDIAVARSKSNTWGNHFATDVNTYVADAMHSVRATLDYYASEWDRSDLQTQFAVVHYEDRPGEPPALKLGNYNAAWIPDCKCIVATDGIRGLAVPLAIDVVGHEITHGAFSLTPALEYAGEPGGLDESNANIFGTMIEFGANDPQEPGDYLVGGTLGANFDARNMAHPSVDNKSADCWYEGLGDTDPHRSSGPADHFFYLLAEGSAASPTCLTTDKDNATGHAVLTGVGREVAANIWYTAMTNYLTSQATYLDARGATILVANYLYNSGSPTYVAVKRAWDAVNVDGTQLFEDFDESSGLPASIEPLGGTVIVTGVQGYAKYGVQHDLRAERNFYSGNLLQMCGPGAGFRVQLGFLPKHTLLHLDFQLAAIDSLDGNTILGVPATGDYLSITLDGRTIFSESFSNESALTQSYLPFNDVTLAHITPIGFQDGSDYNDSAYYMGGEPLLGYIPHSDDTATFEFKFQGLGVQACSDFESFGFDNLRISVATFDGDYRLPGD